MAGMVVHAYILALGRQENRWAFETGLDHNGSTR